MVRYLVSQRDWNTFVIRYSDSPYFLYPLRAYLAESFLLTLHRGSVMCHWHKISSRTVETFRHEYVQVLPIIRIFGDLESEYEQTAKLLSREDRIDALGYYDALVHKTAPYPSAFLRKRPTFAGIKRE